MYETLTHYKTQQQQPPTPQQQQQSNSLMWQSLPPNPAAMSPAGKLTNSVRRPRAPKLFLNL